MNKKLTIVMCLAILCVAGCRSGDFKLTPVIIAQPAPHDGWLISPDLWVTEGQPVPLSGAVVWIKGLDLPEYDQKMCESKSK